MTVTRRRLGPRNLPRGVSAPVNNLRDIPDELPRIIRELLAENDNRRRKSPDEPHYWNGYGLALGDIWKVFEHLYEEA